MKARGYAAGRACEGCGEPAALAGVSIVIAARNEEATLPAALRARSLKSDYFQ